MFDEDSGDAFSPEQPGSQESHGSAPSPGEPKAMEAAPPLPNKLLQVLLCSLLKNEERYLFQLYLKYE